MRDQWSLGVPFFAPKGRSSTCDRRIRGGCCQRRATVAGPDFVVVQIARGRTLRDVELAKLRFLASRGGLPCVRVRAGIATMPLAWLLVSDTGSLRDVAGVGIGDCFCASGAIGVSTPDSCWCSIASVSACSGPTPASVESLAATLQALDDDGYCSHVDAVVWATLCSVIAELPKAVSRADLVADYCLRWSPARSLRARPSARSPYPRWPSRVPESGAADYDRLIVELLLERELGVEALVGVVDAARAGKGSIMLVAGERGAAQTNLPSPRPGGPALLTAGVSRQPQRTPRRATVALTARIRRSLIETPCPSSSSSASIFNPS